MNGLSRREFMSRLGRGAVYCGILGSAGRILPGCEVHDEEPRISGGLRFFFTPTRGASEEAAGRGDEFFIQFGNPGTSVENHPQIADWSLAIGGGSRPNGGEVLVDMDALLAQEAAGNDVVFMKTMRCVLDAPSETLISNAYWQGIPLHVFVEQAEPGPAIQRLRISAADGFESNLRLARVMGERDELSGEPLINPATGLRVFREEGIDPSVELLPVVLAYRMNGEPIPTIHGGPVRLIVPEKFGYKNVKYPQLIELSESTEPFGEYEVRLFDGSPVTDLGNMSLVSVFSGPVEGEAVASRRPDFFGIALFGGGEITGVEVSVDGGEFQAAQIKGIEEILTSGTLAFGEETPETEQDLADLRADLVQLNHADGSQPVDPSFARPLPYVWVLWQFTPDFDLDPGDHSAEVRAFGEPGNASQPETDTDLDDGNSRIRRVRFTVE